MKCHYCGEEVAENQSYCMWCGTRQEPQPEIEPEATEAFSLVQPEPVFETEAHQVEEREPEQNLPVTDMAEELPEFDIPRHIMTAGRKIDDVVPEQPARAVGKYLPRLKLPTRRGLGKMIFLGILTLGIYPMVIWSRIVTELNIAASRYDGERTMPFFGMMFLAPVTLSIYPFVWMHKLCRRIGEELERRGLDYKFGPSAFWLWGVLGSLIVVGPFIFVHKLMKSMNRINADFNVNG